MDVARAGGQRSPRVEDASRDGHLRLRRVERQQALVELLHAARATVPMVEIAERLGVSARTVSRDVERLRDSGLPLQVVRGRQGGARLVAGASPAPVQLDLPEIAAVLSSLAVLGPTVSPSAQSATAKLVQALGGPAAEGVRDVGGSA